MRMQMQTMPAEPQTVAAASPGKEAGLNFPPLQSPPLPISAAKEQRLHQLLEQYRADLLSPEQYHAARAKILAEP
jgi:hypothetical protein